jgi:dihydrofolate reductase
MKITLIAAVSRNGIIGNGNTIPWLGLMKNDMRHFRALTLGKPIVMGRRTFESIGKPLPDRINIVLSQTKKLKGENIVLADSIEDVFNAARGHEELMVIGGSTIYELFLPFASEIHLTVIDHEFDGDVCFPRFVSPEWFMVEYSDMPSDEENLYRYRFERWVKRSEGSS